ncbi:MAG: hypothetical protein WBE76_21420 [Terracidiphilus sp.]
MPIDTTFPDFCPTRDYSEEREWSFDPDAISDGDVVDPDWHISDLEYVLSAIRHKGIVIGRIVPEAFPITDEHAEARSVEQNFYEQAAKWWKEAAHFSSPAQQMMHPSYQAIMGMAAKDSRQVIKLMLRDLQQNHRPWFLALSYLTHANPIRSRDAGKTDKMIKAWVEWGKAQHLL